MRGKIDTDQSRIVRGSLYVMDAGGRHARRLTRGSLDTGPAWAPSGKRIVFVRDHGLSVLDLANGRIGSLGVGSDSEPAWSPDGQRIAFGVGTELETVRPNGTEERTLFDGGDNGVRLRSVVLPGPLTDSRSRLTSSTTTAAGRKSAR